MDLHVSLIQPDTAWEDPEANREALGRHISNLASKTDLIVLPEMFNTGFTMNAAAVAEKMGGPTMQWMEQQAGQWDAVVCGSLAIEESGKYYNRLIWMQPDGSFVTYDKRHLFSLAAEESVFSAGRDRLVVEWRGWKIMPLICYDLRFPVWLRNNMDYDLLLFVANWPEARSRAWNSLLQARAIENQAFVIGVNRTGTDGNGKYHSGNSTIIDPLGNTLHHLKDREGIITETLKKEDLLEIRGKLPFLKDRDEFTIHR